MRYKSIKGEVKSPLRYPGGKSRAVKKIIPIIPKFKEFREPFVGGGSVFIALKQRTRYLDPLYKINDLNKNLYCFWKNARDNNKKLTRKIRDLRNSYQNGRKLYEDFLSKEKKNCFERAVYFFIMNRITFSGLTSSGGYSEQSYKRRFTNSSIDRAEMIKNVLEGVVITNKDYEEVVLEKGEDVFIFLDPPYLKSAKKRLYGNNGDLHVNFSHERFSKVMKKCNHKWLITYDDTEEIRDLFSFANIYTWELQYGMNNYKKSSAKKGKELFISNYDITKIKGKNIKLDKFL